MNIGSVKRLLFFEICKVNLQWDAKDWVFRTLSMSCLIIDLNLFTFFHNNQLEIL